MNTWALAISSSSSVPSKTHYAQHLTNAFTKGINSAKVDETQVFSKLLWSKLLKTNYRYDNNKSKKIEHQTTDTFMSFRRTSLDSLKCAVGPSGNPTISRASNIKTNKMSKASLSSTNFRPDMMNSYQVLFDLCGQQ